MKSKDLKNRIKEIGWYFLRNGNEHEIWTNGKYIQPIPFKKEINRLLSLTIIKRCKNYNNFIKG